MLNPSPCPFCKRPTNSFRTLGGIRVWCTYADCGAEGPVRENTDDAITAWNAYATRQSERERLLIAVTAKMVRHGVAEQVMALPYLLYENAHATAINYPAPTAEQVEAEMERMKV